MRDSTHVTVFGTSLNPRSRSYGLAVATTRTLADRGVPATLVDLRDRELPECGREGSYDDPTVNELRALAARSSHLVFAAPVYNFQLGSGAKNLVELIGRGGLEGKTVGLLCSAGGRRSYMAPMTFANALMLDFRCWIVPRFVFGVPDDFDDDGAIANPALVERVEGMVGDLLSRA
jgi:FMN reductase